jgi:hypothetical protein
MHSGSALAPREEPSCLVGYETCLRYNPQLPVASGLSQVTPPRVDQSDSGAPGARVHCRGSRTLRPITRSVVRFQ